MRVNIDGKTVEVEAGATVLDACDAAGAEVPRLCHIPELPPEGSCRMCLVEIEGQRLLKPACATPAEDGMTVRTASERCFAARRFVLGLLLSNHDKDCFACPKSGECKLQNYCYEYGVETSPYEGGRSAAVSDDSNPFFIYNAQKCILCRRCVRTCRGRQSVGAICVSGRGFDAAVRTPFEGLLRDSDVCVSCGNCVSACPTGALLPKTRERYRLWEVEKTLTTCAYCGVGCQLRLLSKKGRVVGAEPANGPTNRGLLCVKGKFAHNFINHPDRLTTPLIRKDGALVPASWDEALSFVAERLTAIKAQSGADAIAGLSSARATNEDNYAFMKLLRAAIGTNNIDHCARLCHASTVAGLAGTLGSGAMTNSIPETAEADVIFITGSNTTETHPVIGAQIRQALYRGARLIVAEPRRIDLAKQAEVFLQLRPGTNVALYNAMMHVIIAEGLADAEYIKKRTENFDALRALVAAYPPERAAEICGVSAEDIRRAARLYATAEKAPIFYSMGVTQHSTGTAGVQSISNLALLCGKIGRYGCGVNPLRGQNNVQGACDMGCLPTDYTGYKKVADDVARAAMERAWGVSLPAAKGKTVTEIMDAALAGEVRALYIMGENPMLSDPDQNHVRKALEKCEFLIVQDIFETETTAYADVVLPACTFAEKDGTFTSTDRRVQRVRAAIPPVGESRPDWAIASELSRRLGYDSGFSSPEQIFAEIASVTAQYAGMSYARLERESLCWPCPTPDSAGTPVMHEKAFTRGARALFIPHEYQPPQELPDAEYPLLLTTGRVLYQYHTRTMTGKNDALNAVAGSAFIELNTRDAACLGIADGETVLVRSRRGEVCVAARVTDDIKGGVAFMPFHYADAPANILTNAALDPTAKIPEFKVCAVRIERKG